MEKQKSKFSQWVRNSITARMLIVGFLLLILLIPLEFVKSLIYERSLRQKEVIHEINEKWGNEVLISGPILEIPYLTYVENKTYAEKSEIPVTNYIPVKKKAWFFPENLNIDSQVDTLDRNRSIYKSVVFTANMKFTGDFPVIEFSDTNISEEDILWEEARIILQTTNTKGIKSDLVLSLAGNEWNMISTFDNGYMRNIVSEQQLDYNKLAKEVVPFSLDMKIQGSESLKFIPIGKRTTASMQSNWHSPGFDGEFLPEDNSKEISENGFSAQWDIFHLSRSFEQSFFGTLPDLQNYAFGTNFVEPVNDYVKTERTSKYGFMVIGLTLLVFLMIQIASGIYIHPLQYIMIGLALVLFYTLLIAISEHSTFAKAYTLAGFSVLLLITLYARSILKNFKFPLLVCLSLTGLYSFIYVIIQLENYALLAGSIGMFLILAIIMYASRKIDWN